MPSVIEHCEGIDWEWIIGENGSTDGSYEYLASLKHPRIKVLKKKNQGNFSTMNNDLVRHATGEYLCFLNNDTEATSNFLKEMLDLIETDKSIGVVGATLFYPDGNLQHCGVLIDPNGNPVNISTPLYNNAHTLNRELHTANREYQSVTGACLLMSKADFNWVWGFEPSYNWAYEDVDLCLKVKYHMGKKIVGCASAKLKHYESYSKANPNLEPNINFLKTRWNSVVESDIGQYGDKTSRLYRFQPRDSDMTFVVCVNNIETLNRCMISSLKQNHQNFSLVVIYNMDNRRTAAQALNYGIEQSKTEFIILSHQDVEYNHEWTLQFLKEAAKNKGFGVAGLAGVRRMPAKTHNTLLINNHIHINCIGEITYPFRGRRHKYGQYSDGRVEIIDELSLIIRKSTGLRFDETTLTHFHFYGVDLCLSSLEKGFFNVVLNCPAYHDSGGSSSLGQNLDVYWREFKKVHAKWKRKFPIMVGTTGFWDNNVIQTFITEADLDAKKDVTPKENRSIAPGIVINPNQPVEMVVNNTQKFSITGQVTNTKWFLNGTLVAENKDHINFEPETKGLHKIRVSFLAEGKRPSEHEWLVQVNAETKDGKVFVGMSQPMHHQIFGEIYGNKVVSQEFVCDSERLTRIDVFTGTFRRRNACNLNLAVKSSHDGDLIRFSTIMGINAEDNDWTSFYFDPIMDSKNKKYCLEFSSPDGSPGNSVTLYYIGHNFNFGSLYYNGRRVNGCLSFRLLYAKP